MAWFYPVTVPALAVAILSFPRHHRTGRRVTRWHRSRVHSLGGVTRNCPGSPAPCGSTRNPSIPAQGIDWQKFVSNADYRAYTLLPIASTAWKNYAGTQFMGFVRVLAKDGYKAVFLWLCANFPDSMVGAGDSKTDAIAEITMDFLGNLFDPSRVQQALADNADLQCAQVSQGFAPDFSPRLKVRKGRAA